LLLLTLTILLGTGWGRGVVLRTALSIVNRSIPGELSAEALQRLDETGLRLENVVVRDPQGEEVARLGVLELHWDLLEALHSTALGERARYIVQGAEIANGKVDLRHLQEAERGLSAAFVDPNQPAEPTPPAPGPPPYVRVDHLTLHGVDVLLPELPSVGELAVRDLLVEGYFELDGSPRARLRHSAARIERGGEPLGALDSLAVFVGRDRERSSVSLALRLAGMRLSADGSLVVPPSAKWDHEPLEATVSVRSVTGSALARLLQDASLVDAFLGQLDLTAELRGTPAHPRLSARLETAGGVLRLAAQAREFEAADVTLATDRLVLGAVRADLPTEPLAFVLQANARRAEDAWAAEVHLRRAASAGKPLPDVDVTGRLEQERLRDLRLRVADGESRLVARGDVDLNGHGRLEGAGDLHRTTVLRILRLFGLSGDAGEWTSFRFEVARDEREQITSRGDLRSAGFRLEDNGFGAARARWDVQLDLSGWQDRTGFPKVRGMLETTIEDAHFGGRTVEEAHLELTGTGDQVRLEARGKSQELQASAHLRALAGNGQLTLEGSVAGTHDNTPFSAKIGATNVTPAGRVQTSGIELSVAGQTLRVHGEAAPDAVDLRLETGPVQLAELGRELGFAPTLRGTVDVRGKLEGSLQLPVVALQVTGLGLGLEGRPELDTLLDFRLDAPQGKLAFDLDMRTSGSSRLALEADGSATFPGGPGWQEHLPQSAGAFSLELGRLDLELVEQWVPELDLPLSGVVQGEVQARGTLLAPEVEGRIDADLRRKGGQTPLGAHLLLRLTGNDVNLFGRLSDPSGSLADLAAAAELPTKLGPPGETPEPATPERPTVIDRLVALPAAGRWSVRVLTPERELRTVGFVLERDDVPALAYAGELYLDHEPHQEPEALLRASATQLEPYPESSACEGGPLRVEVSAALRQGQLRAGAAGSSPQRRLFELEAQGQVAVAPLLAGGKADLGPLDARILAERVPLRALPVVCESVTGELTARARLQNVLGPDPAFEARVEARDVTLGPPQTVTVTLQAQANAERAAVDLRLAAPSATSRARASLPITWKNGSLVVQRDAALRGDVRLRELPIAPFAPRAGPVSYAAGSVDGAVTLRGTLDKPDLDGVLELKDVSFTLTDVAQPLRDVTGRFRFTERTLHIENFEAHDRDGSFGLTGNVALDGRERVRADFQIDAKRFPVRRLGQVLATADLQANVRTDVLPERTDVNVVLEDVHVWIESTELRRGIALEPHPHFVIDGERPHAAREDEEPEDQPGAVTARQQTPEETTRHAEGGEAPEVAAPSPAETAPPETEATPAATPDEATPRVTRFDVETRGRFWVNRKDFAVRLDADVSGETRGEETVLRGDVLIDRGYVTLLGRVFDLEKNSRLTFVGSSPPDPVLRIRAVHENRRTGRRVELRIGGRASQPELTFFVDGERTEAGGALLAIYGSERTSQDPASAQQQAAGFVGGLTAGLLATTARRKLGAAAPILMIDPGQTAGQGRVRAGFELDALVPQILRGLITGVYFEGIVAREGADATPRSTPSSGRTQQEARVQGGVLLEFYFPNNFFNTNQYGPGATWSVDVGWQL
jgi:hypothetical protein